MRILLQRCLHLLPTSGNYCEAPWAAIAGPFEWIEILWLSGWSVVVFPHEGDVKSCFVQSSCRRGLKPFTSAKLKMNIWRRAATSEEILEIPQRSFSSSWGHARPAACSQRAVSLSVLTFSTYVKCMRNRLCTQEEMEHAWCCMLWYIGIVDIGPCLQVNQGVGDVWSHFSRMFIQSF